MNEKKKNGNKISYFGFRKIRRKIWKTEGKEKYKIVIKSMLCGERLSSIMVSSDRFYCSESVKMKEIFINI